MRYEKVQLGVDTETARDRITESVPDVRTTTTPGRIEFHTNSGLMLASLTDTTLPSGEPGSVLRYRTTRISAQLSHAQRQGTAIKKAVENYTI